MRWGELSFVEGGERREVIAGEQLGRSWAPDDNFIAAIRGREEIQALPQQGLRVIQLTEAAWRSADSGAKAEVLR